MIMTSHPFGRKLEVADRATVAQYDLDMKWRKIVGSDRHEMADKARDPKCL